MLTRELNAADPQKVMKPVERAAKEVVKDVKQAVKGGPQAPTPPAPPKSAPKEVKSAVREAPKILNQDVLDKVRAAGMQHCILCYHLFKGGCVVFNCPPWPLSVSVLTFVFLRRSELLQRRLPRLL